MMGFESILKSSGSSSGKLITGVRVKTYRLHDKEYFQFTLGKDVLQQAGLEKGDRVDLQLDHDSGLTLIGKTSGQQGNKLMQLNKAAVALQVRFNIADRYKSLFRSESVIDLEIVEIKKGKIIFKVPNSE